MRFLVLLFGSLVVISALGAGLVCAVGAVAAWGGRSSGRLDILTHFAPVWLVGGAAAVATALFIRPPLLKAAIIVPGAVAVVAAGGLILREFARPMTPRAPPGAPHQLKVIQFNTWRNNVDLPGTARWIADQDADIVVMEEARPDLVAAIRKLRPYHLTDPRAPVVILSRAPPRDITIRRTRRSGKRAVMARATFAPADGGFTVVGVHYTWPTRVWVQAAQAADLAGVLDGLDRSRLILCGDFNSTPWSFARRRDDARFGIERRTRAVFSWPARNSTRHPMLVVVPFLPIDHVYAGPAWRTVSVERGPRLGSDHYPVVVKLALEP